MSEISQLSFLDDPGEEWEGMPEFIQLDRESIMHVIIHFETMEDVKAFAKLIGRNITAETKAIFFPVKDNEKFYYVDES